MSEKARKTAGICLIPAAVLLLLAGLLPLKPQTVASYTGRGDGSVSIPPVRHLSAQDGFNTGKEDTLTAYPGIGGAIASLVTAERNENGIFYYPEDILAVKGIGEKKLEQIRPFLITEAEESEE